MSQGQLEDEPKAEGDRDGDGEMAMVRGELYTFGIDFMQKRNQATVQVTELGNQ